MEAVGTNGGRTMQETLIDRLYEALRPDWTIWETEFTEQAEIATTEDLPCKPYQ